MVVLVCCETRGDVANRFMAIRFIRCEFLVETVQISPILVVI